ncbi:hypothetical protein BDZ90DRAFT_51548 [Jaminaea rosea]|uniref:Stress response protein NST1 n=1 Tax=Jaminaea rosea TaxID=1569628 RepID=A0A316ULZ1_9BASI|nr:hypothetical protein BDZ90DRAFT_51548 [Jaminaea rosea]PWN26302.1 hypothetical protein BDZ90DRAFT_51548 [Jaminaea rosea]
MAKAKAPLRAPPSSRPTAQPPPPQSQPTSLDHDSSSPTPPPLSTEPSAAAAAAAAAAAKKKKRKGKGKRIEDPYDGTAPLSPATTQAYAAHGNSPAHLSQAATAQAQAQADLLATASDLYRRIEADPQGIPDDDAYWTSLPAHLRTFIRNALPLGQFPTTGNGHPNDPNARHASTQAMIAVAQQLAQAAHASQRHLQQYPPGSQPYPSLPFDPAIFADLALHSDPGATLHSHTNGVHAAAGNAAQSPYSAHVHYSTTGANPPPTQPPGEPLPAPVVLVNEYGEETGDYDDEYYSDDDLDDPNGVSHDDGMHGGPDARNWPAHEQQRQQAAAAMLGAPPSKKKNKKKKKKTGADTLAAPPPPSQPLPPPAPAVQHGKQPATNGPPAPAPPRSNAPPPSSRAAGKQPMTFNSNASAKAPAPNGHSHPPAKSRAGAAAGSVSSHGTGHGTAPPSQAQAPRIWSTSTAEERERIKEFWMRLNERDRRSLVAIEKDAVLKRMKEQSRHSCTCAVCSRKRTAIESELDVLYNAYYDELEQYANQQQQYVRSGGAVPPPPGPGPFPGSIALDSAGNVLGGNALTKPVPPAQKTRVTAPPKKAPPPPVDDDDGYDDELDDDEYDDDYDDEEEEEEDEVLPETAPPRSKRNAAGGNAGGADSSLLGSSLTVKGILTVADDLLKNDGQKFLEMMEQLADRRMQREEDAATAGADGVSDDGDDVDDVDDVEEDEEDDALTDEQRMEEGRRMFQIFAARLFEQRVLAAYRERIAQERQLQLLRELEEEADLEKEKDAKRQRENQKKKDKKRQQQLKKEEERLKRESEKAAEEAAAREKAEKLREAELKRQEEARLKREAEKKGQCCASHVCSTTSRYDGSCRWWCLDPTSSSYGSFVRPSGSLADGLFAGHVNSPSSAIRLAGSTFVQGTC